MSFPLYEQSLLESWRLLASADPGARVVEDQDAVTMSHSHPLLRNAILRSPAGLARIREVFGDRHHALWVRQPGAGLEAAGYERDEHTVPMVLDLDGWAGTPTVPVRSVAPIEVARHSGVEIAMPPAYGFATGQWESWALTMMTGAVANISFVTTRDEFQRRGLGRAVMTHLLLDAQQRGARHAALQSSPAGVRLYHGLGFRDVGLWQEWVPAGGVPAG
ncbi:GNAT family N-acetyltransferase [Actinoplanes sp. TRM 88003]|uniref:GNAT family N-acetyltransferase n=1 Tax=Paractinoplanes aksuensis TaxID=2939490 RepID=A0ABT1E7D4_9ACTN|nr:GNAT family N-acetyltransferase [Actinoplanes aksuensis]MCO8277721.1 GNAT family N-acetyltransferase [Actinoplanes aksuensis]